MNTPSQFLPCLKQMLGFHRYGPWPLLIWLALSSTCLTASSVFMLMQHPSSPDFMHELLVWSCLAWLYLMLVASPVPFQILGGLVSLEFLFTRALDRAVWLRAERTTVLIIAVAPLLFNLLLSPLSPKLTFEPAEPGTPEAAKQARYLAAFPDSQLVPADPTGHPEHWIVHHGTEMFAAWLMWTGLLVVFLVAVYWTVAFTGWQRGGWHHSRSKWKPWLGFVMIQTPFFIPVGLMVICAALRINPAEECFLFFAQHPVAMALSLVALMAVAQPLSERHIRELEFEFF